MNFTAEELAELESLKDHFEPDEFADLVNHQAEQVARQKAAERISAIVERACRRDQQ